MEISQDAKHDFLRRYGIPKNWQAVRLGDLADIVGGGTPSRDERSYWDGGDIPWATPTDITANQAKYLRQTSECVTKAGVSSSAATILPVDTILYTSRATIGAKALASVPVATNQGFANFIPRADKVTAGYLYYLLELLTPTIKRLGSGTTFLEISRRDMRTVWCAIPSPDEQAAIARVLDAADVAIEWTREAIARAREVKASLQRDLLAGKTNKILSANNFVDAAKFAYRAGWEVKRLSQSGCVVVNPETLTERTTPSDTQFKYIDIASVNNGEIDWGSVETVRFSEAPSRARRVVRTGDIIVCTVRPLLMSHTYADWQAPDWHVCSTGFAVLRCHGNLLSSFARHLPFTDQVTRQLVTVQCGTNYPAVNERDIKNLWIPIPPRKEQEEIAAIFDANDKVIAAQKDKLRKMHEVKKSLMHDLLSGSVRAGTVK